MYDMSARDHLGQQWPDHYNVNILYNQYGGDKPHAAYLGTSFHANVNDEDAASLEAWGRSKRNAWMDEHDASE